MHTTIVARVVLPCTVPVVIVVSHDIAITVGSRDTLPNLVDRDQSADHKL